jgi:hypothetical protein
MCSLVQMLAQAVSSYTTGILRGANRQRPPSSGTRLLDGVEGDRQG